MHELPEASEEGVSFFERAEKTLNRDAKEFFAEFANEFQSLYERANGIFLVAQLDDQLTGLLKDFFVNENETTRRLLGDTGGLGTFGIRIELAFLLGLISIRERRLLNLLRRVRNDFAHNSEVVSFNQSPIKDRCLELDVTRAWGKKRRESKETTNLSEPLGKFVTTFEYLTYVLAYRRDRIEQRYKAEPITENDIVSEINTLQTNRRQ